MLIVLNLTGVFGLVFFTVEVLRLRLVDGGGPWGGRNQGVRTEFCLKQAAQVVNIFEVGDRHLLLETSADISSSRQNQLQPQLFWLYDWRSGRLSPRPLPIGAILPNITSNGEELIFASSLNLCTLFLDPLDQPRKRRSLPGNLIPIDNARYSNNNYNNEGRRRSVDLEEIRNLLRSNLKQTVESDHEEIKKQLRMFDLQMQLLNERLAKLTGGEGGAQVELPSDPIARPRGSNHADNDLWNVDDSYSPSSKNRDFAKCPKLIIATFCTRQWSSENDICADTGRPCWYRSQFYQDLTGNQTLKLISVPYTQRALVNLLHYRGLFHFDSGFVLIDSKLRCESGQNGEKATNPGKVFTFRRRLFSGFNVDGQTIVQTRPGRVEFLTTQLGISIAEMMNCYHNSSLIQSTPWIAQDPPKPTPPPTPRRPPPPPPGPKGRFNSKSKARYDESDEDYDDEEEEDISKEKRPNLRKKEPISSKTETIPPKNEPIPLTKDSEQEKVDEEFGQEQLDKVKEKPIEVSKPEYEDPEEEEEVTTMLSKSHSILSKWYWYVIAATFFLFCFCYFRRGDGEPDERELARKQRARRRKRLLLRNRRSKSSTRRSKRRRSAKPSEEASGSEKEISVLGVEQVEVLGDDQQDDWKPFAGYLNSIVSTYYHLVGKVIPSHTDSPMLEIDPQHLEQVEPVEVRSGLKSLVEDSQVIMRVLPFVSGEIHQQGPTKQETTSES